MPIGMSYMSKLKRLMSIASEMKTNTYQLKPAVQSVSEESNELISYIDAYLIVPRLTRSDQKYDFKQFFLKGLEKIDKKIIHSHLFIDKCQAIQYAKCVSSKGGILHARIPESAVIGHHDKLSLRPQVIHREHVLGLYLSHGNNDDYVLNPLRQSV